MTTWNVPQDPLSQKTDRETDRKKEGRKKEREKENKRIKIYHKVE